MGFQNVFALDKQISYDKLISRFSRDPVMISSLQIFVTFFVLKINVIFFFVSKSILKCNLSAYNFENEIQSNFF